MAVNNLSIIMVIYPLTLLLLALFALGFWRSTGNRAFVLAALHAFSQLVGPPVLGLTQDLPAPFTHVGMIFSVLNGVTLSLLLQQMLGYTTGFAFEGVVALIGLTIGLAINGNDDLSWFVRMLPLELPLLLTNVRVCVCLWRKRVTGLGYAGSAYVAATVAMSIFLFSFGFCVDHPEYLTAGWSTAMMLGLCEVFMLQAWLLERSVRDHVETENDLRTVRALQNTARLTQVGQLAASLIHEIAQPIQVIRSSLSMLQDGAMNDPGKLVTGLGRIERQSDRLAKLVAVMRSAVREGLKEENVWVDVAKVVTEVQDFLRSRLDAQETKLEIQLDPNLTLEWNAIFLTQVLVNLINNAADAVKDLPVRWIRIEARQTNTGGLLISCTDSGEGIPPGIAEQVFKPLFTTKPVGQGSGLGLSFCNLLVQNRSGRIALDSQSPHTRFVVEIPALGTSAQPILAA